jgi:hypothetical protein
MAIFNRSVKKAAISPQPTKAAAAGGTFYQNNNAGAQLVGNIILTLKARHVIVQ